MSAEALRKHQRDDEEQAALADLHKHGELLRIRGGDTGGWWWAPDRGRGNGGIGGLPYHSPDVISRLKARGDVVLLQNGTRCQLAPKRR